MQVATFPAEPERADSYLPIAASVSVDEGRSRMPPAKLCQVIGCGFAGPVASYLQPGMLQDGRFHRHRAFDDRVQFGSIAAPRHPQLDTHHRSIAHAAVKLLEAESR